MPAQVLMTISGFCKILRMKPIIFLISSMLEFNNKQPECADFTEPCGTPTPTEKGELKYSSMRTFCILLVRKLVNHLNATPLTPTVSI